MAPFSVNHPTLLNNWIMAREKSLKQIREIKNVKKEDIELFLTCLKKSIKNIQMIIWLSHMMTLMSSVLRSFQFYSHMSMEIF